MANQINLPSYSEFQVTEDPEISSKWEDWLEGFESMMGAMKVTAQLEKRTMLMYYIGGSGRKVIKRLDDIGVDADANCYTQLKDALNNHFKPKLNRVYGMNMLHQVTQRQGETIDNFLIRVKEKVAVIEIDKLDKHQIIDLITLAHLVNHCNNKQVKHKAIRDDLSLANFMATAIAAERAEHQLKEMEGADGSSSSSVNKVHRDRGRTQQKENNFKGGRKRSKSGNRRRSQSRPRKGKSCFRCGGAYPHDGVIHALELDISLKYVIQKRIR